MTIDTRTGEILDLDQHAARRLTDKIKVGVEGVWHLIEEAYTSRAWAALGYSSWDDYCTREFGTSRLRLPREDRPEVVASLRESGLSIRAIVAATGISDQTVQRDLKAGVVNHYASTVAPTDNPAAGATGSRDEDRCTVPGHGWHGGMPCSVLDPEGHLAWMEDLDNSAPHPAITGTDGKKYPATPKFPAKPRRRSSLPDAAMSAAHKLRKKAESIERILADDRFAQNKEQISLLSRSDLLYVQRVVAAALEQLPITEG